METIVNTNPCYINIGNGLYENSLREKFPELVRQIIKKESWIFITPPTPKEGGRGEKFDRKRKEKKFSKCAQHGNNIAFLKKFI